MFPSSCDSSCFKTATTDSFCNETEVISSRRFVLQNCILQSAGSEQISCYIVWRKLITLFLKFVVYLLRLRTSLRLSAPLGMKYNLFSSFMFVLLITFTDLCYFHRYISLSCTSCVYIFSFLSLHSFSLIVTMCSSDVNHSVMSFSVVLFKTAAYQAKIHFF